MLMAVSVGAGLAVQAGVNARLRLGTGSALWAAMISSMLTVVLFVIAQLIVRDPLPMSGLSRQPWWVWTGGIMGAAYVFGVVYLTRSLGVAALFIAIVAGQLLAGLLIDHFGWFNVPVQPINGARIAGAVLVVAGIMLIRR